MRTLLQNLPPEIQSLATFVLWDSVTDKNGNEAKKPFDPQSKGRGNDDPSLHLGLNQALRMLQAFPQKKLGIGLYQPEGGIRLSAEAIGFELKVETTKLPKYRPWGEPMGSSLDDVKAHLLSQFKDPMGVVKGWQLYPSPQWALPAKVKGQRMPKRKPQDVP